MLTNVASQNESKSLMRQVVTCHKKKPLLIGRHFGHVDWPGRGHVTV